jgi:hypothetical protein
MIKQMFAILFLLLSCIIFAQVPEWQWAVRFGGPSNDEIKSVASDSQGNVYITGDFWETVSFGSFTLTSLGQGDIFVAKLDSQGNFLWARRAGGIGFDWGNSIAVDSTGNSYITGMFSGTADFAATNLVSDGVCDLFVAKLDTNGYLSWAVQAGGSFNDEGRGIALDNSGNIFLTGYFYDTATFGTHTITSFGNQDIFVSKLDNDGNWLWCAGAGGTSMDMGNSVATDIQGNVYAVGYFQQTATFGATELTSLGSFDLFISKMSPDGFLLGAFRAGGIGQDEATGITLDTQGNIYFTGYFGYSISFGPFFLTARGQRDIFVTKMNSGAIYQWANRAGGDGWDLGAGIVTDALGNSFTTGSFYETADFANLNFTSFGSYDVYVAKLDTNGLLGGVMQAGGTGGDNGTAIATDGANSFYVVGKFYGSASFGTHTLVSVTAEDCFVAKIYAPPVSDPDEPLNPEVNTIQLSVYPNPVSKGQEIHISLKTSESKNATLSVYNLKGQLMDTRKLTHGNQNTNLSTSLYNAGVYLLCLKSGMETAVKKLVIIK